MKQTPLYDEHIVLEGRMVDFAGWQLPVMYGSIVEEHHAVRKAAGIFDVSHMGEIALRGGGAADTLRRLIPTDPGRLAPGKSMYSCLCNESGGVIDDLFVYMFNEEYYYLVVNAATLEKDLRWIREHALPRTEITDLSPGTAKIDLQGPLSREVADRIFGDEKTAALPRFGFVETFFKGAPVMVSQSGYTGEFGYEFYLSPAVVATLWNRLLMEGKDYGLRPCGLGSRDSLRLEACYSLYGHELSESITPLEGGIGWIVNSPHDYIGKEALDFMEASGTPRRIYCFELTQKGVPRETCAVLKDGVALGVVTSAGFSPTFGKGIGMALLAADSVKAGDEVDVVVRERPLRAKITERPFYKYGGG